MSPLFDLILFTQFSTVHINEYYEHYDSVIYLHLDVYSPLISLICFALDSLTITDDATRCANRQIAMENCSFYFIQLTIHSYMHVYTHTHIFLYKSLHCEFTFAQRD